MKTYILSDFDEIKSSVYKFNQFANDAGSSLPFHRLQMPLLWWKYFSSKDNIDFGQKRGRNFFGAKCWFKNLVFIIVEIKGSICGIAPLFKSEVLIRGSREPLEILSFCPDSGLIFYQDFLIHPQLKNDIIHKIFQNIEVIIEPKKSLLFLGHIPEDSKNSIFYQKEIEQRLENGWQGGKAKNCWRGGVYPWNTLKLCKILKKCLTDYPDGVEIIKSELEEFINDLQDHSPALMLFPSTRKKFEARLTEIIHTFEKYPELVQYKHAISEILASKPIIYPFLTLPGDTNEFYSLLSSSKRQFFRRYLKKFLSAGGVFENIAPENISKSDIKEYLSLHAMRWGAESAALTDNTRFFHEELSLEMAKAGYLRLFFAKINGKRIATLSCFDINGRREFYYSGRSLIDYKLSVGKLLVMYSVLDAIDKSFKVYDFGYGGDEYKFDFTKEYKTLNSFFLTKSNTLPDLQKLFPMYEEFVLQ